MAKKRVAAEFGMGTSLRRMDYTKAADRAIRDALWHNSLTMAQAFGFDKEDMIIDVEIAVQDPDAVDKDALLSIFPYGQASITCVKGGLDIAKPDSQDHTVIAHAAILVSFDMEATS